MSVTNLGTQTINWKYKTSLKGSNLSKMFNGCISPGIYLNNGAYITSGTGLVTSFADNQITINAFTAVFKASSTQTVTISTAAPIMLSTDGGLGYITASAPYITMSYTWADQIINYIDFAFKTSLDINSNDIVIGKAVFTGGSVTSIDYSEASYPISYNPQTNMTTNYGGLTTRERDILIVPISTADVTITEAQAQYSTIKLTGTLTGNRNLILPNIERKYTIINDASSPNYYITIKTETGTVSVYSSTSQISEVRIVNSNQVVALQTLPIDLWAPQGEGLNISMSSPGNVKITGLTNSYNMFGAFDSSSQRFYFKNSGIYSIMYDGRFDSSSMKLIGAYTITPRMDGTNFLMGTTSQVTSLAYTTHVCGSFTGFFNRNSYLEFIAYTDNTVADCKFQDLYTRIIQIR